MIVWNFPSSDLQWKVDIIIEANSSSNVENFSCDLPKILLYPDLLLADEIEKGDIKEDRL